ncbi:MAG: isoprenoid biosynthesis protein [Gammaproteobacteria bacterium]|nr:isoprenoid biosynthesis protein [Gammaproteobacteria bacterium]
MKKIAVVLSGCGVFDGAEIHEAVLILLAIDNNGARYQCVAPNVWQRQVVNHLTQQISDEKRNVLVEAARIARGEIKDIAAVKVDEFDAAVFVGGFGVVTNLSDFSKQDVNFQLEASTLKFAKAMYDAKKPLGFSCISPVLAAKICDAGVKLTVGNDKELAKKLETMGAEHEDCSPENIIVDKHHHVVSTPAYMLGKGPAEIYQGIEAMVRHILLIA